jgi:ABC-type antimicrobial peptide transport system permease subunit
VTAPKTLSATVIGIMPTNNFETAMNVFVPKALFNKISENKTTYTKKLYGENATNSTNKNKYDTVQVKVKNEKQVTAVQEAIKALNFSVFSYVEYLNELKKISNSIQMILGGIGAISLFVAAIGITNTMMMSTYERTKEIGIMKVIGARISDIKKMFLTEALMIGAIGGGIGVLFSYIVSFLMNYFLKDLASGFMGIEGARLSVIPIWLAVAALLFSMLIGLISGYFPARRAMKLSALTAIRTE